MAKNAPIIAGTTSVGVKLEGGQTYFWYRCGRSKTQLFCDGSHAGTDITLLKFTREEDGSAALCQCKATTNAPFCDGAYISLGALSPGDPAPRPSLENHHTPHPSSHFDPDPATSPSNPRSGSTRLEPRSLKLETLSPAHG